jgi:hypothetical protein
VNLERTDSRTFEPTALGDALDLYEDSGLHHLKSEISETETKQI